MGAFFLLFLFAAGCVPVGQVTLPEDVGRAITRTDFGQLEPGAKSQTSLHFEVKAYDSRSVEEISKLAERLYERVMNDTGLYSFMPP
jgi:hypothetical protein